MVSKARGEQNRQVPDDMVLKVSEENISTPEKLYNSMIAIEDGKVVPVSSLSKMQRTSGITQIRHLERQRAEQRGEGSDRHEGDHRGHRGDFFQTGLSCNP